MVLVDKSSEQKSSTVFNQHGIFHSQEMVIDKVNGQSWPRYLVYDIIRFMDEDFMERPFFPDRLECIRVQVVGENSSKL